MRHPDKTEVVLVRPELVWQGKVGRDLLVQHKSVGRAVKGEDGPFHGLAKAGEELDTLAKNPFSPS